MDDREEDNREESVPDIKARYNMWQNTAYMVRECWSTHKSVILLVVMLAVIAVGINVAELFVVPVILKKVESAAQLSEILITILGFILLILLLKALDTYIDANILFGRVAVRLGISSEIGNKVCTTSFPNTEDTEVLKKLSKANEAVSSNAGAVEAIWTTLTEIIKNCLGFIIYVSLLSSLDMFIILVICSTTIIGYFLGKHINEWAYIHRKEEAEYVSELRYINEKKENLAYAKEFRIFGMLSWLDEVYVTSKKMFYAFMAKREMHYLMANVIDVILLIIRNAVAYLYLLNKAIDTSMPVSEFLVYFTAVSGFTAWIKGILDNLSELHKQSFDISIVREYLETPEMFKYEEGLHLEKNPDKKYRIELRDVSFKYSESDKYIYRHLNLVIESGEKLAIVGLNGAGKTTLVKLICGFYDPTEGEVLLNGVNIKDYNRRDYYRLFAAVFQQFSLLECTVAENVAQTDKNIDFEKVEMALKKAGIYEKIMSLPGEYKAHLGRMVYEDGIDLSGGEMQRLMLARALYKDAPILVLDEPTAALDPIAENDIYMKYSEITDGCTSIYISHRLASTRFCDRIILIDKGGIIESGTHRELMELNGKYAELFDIQSKYYKEECAIDE